MFDFIRFCEQHDIPYVTRGVNKKVADDCNISCPFCNQSQDPDPSMHLGVNSELGVYSCWRNPTKHRGRTLHRLIMALRRCSYAEARTILGQQPLWLKEDQFEEFASDPSGWFAEEPEEELELGLPKEVRPFGSAFTSEQRFTNYLVERGFCRATLNKFSDYYGLCWAISGKFKNRIIIPNRLEGRLVNWTGRSIDPKQSVRYLTLSEGNGAIVNIKKIIFNWDSLVAEPGDLVIICEGPFDALTMDWFGRSKGLRASCIFGQVPTIEQLSYVAALTDLYWEVIIMLDSTASEMAEHFRNQLIWLPNVSWYQLPKGIKDPGELSSKQVRLLAKELKNKYYER